MRRWFFKIFYLIASVNAIMVMCKIFAGQEYVRDRPVHLVGKNNGSSNVSESWPFKMQLRLGNYLCNTPTPNIDVAEETLINAWKLPPKTHLSPIMRDIARCHVAASKMASKDFDSNNCNCVRSWPISLLVLVLVCLVFNVYRLVFGFPIDDAPGETSVHAKLYVLACIPFMLWFAIMTMVALHVLDVLDIGFWYTIYGDMYPTSYYSASAEWRSVIRPILIAYYINAVEVFAHAFSMISCRNLIEKAKSWMVPKMKIIISIPNRAYGSSGSDEIVKPIAFYEIKVKK